MKKWLIIGAVSLLFIAGVGWMIKELSKPLPGVQFEDLGREHVTDISNVHYNSNPPTSGSHFPVWAKRGVYDRVLSDGYLIHSLEHGYIVVSYNCGKQFSIFHFPFSIFRAYAQEQMEASSTAKPLTKMNVGVIGAMSSFTPSNPPGVEVELPKSFQTPACKKLVSDLSVFLKDFQRVVIVPRPNMDAPIILTAWSRMEKFNKFDKEKMEEFISAFHNKGPEQTVE